MFLRRAATSALAAPRVERALINTQRSVVTISSSCGAKRLLSVPTSSPEPSHAPNNKPAFSVSKAFVLTYTARGAVPTSASPLYSFVQRDQLAQLINSFSQQSPSVALPDLPAHRPTIQEVMEEAALDGEEDSAAVYADSVLRKRRKKMNRHKLRQLKRRTRNQDKGAK